MSSGVPERLRSWARGMYACEAGVELLIRSFGGRFAEQGWPWIMTGRSGQCWVDPEAIGDHAGCLSGGEQRVLRMVAALIGAGVVEDLGGLLSGLDRDRQALVLAALSHAGGSHDHARLVYGADGVWFDRLPPLVPWPCLDSGGSVAGETVLT